MGKCRTCKFWYRGEKIHYSETSVNWDGSPHALAGKVVVNRPWAGRFNDILGPFGKGDEQDTGECRSRDALGGLVEKRPLLVTSGFGCDAWAHDDCADKLEHIYMDHRGQQSLAEHKAEMAAQPNEYAEPIGIVGDPHKIDKKGWEGWVLYPDPPEVSWLFKPIEGAAPAAPEGEKE